MSGFVRARYGRLPYRLFTSERYVETGPDKVTGFFEEEFAFKLQMQLESDSIIVHSTSNFPFFLLF